MPVLKNPRHEKFAQEVAKGKQAGPAYLAIYKCSGPTAETEGPRLLRESQVSARVEEILEKAASKTVFTLEKAIEYIEEVLMTPIGEVDANHKLCQEYSETSGQNGSSVRYKMPSKEGMLDKLAKLRGWYKPEKVEVEAGDTLTAFMARLATGREKAD